MIVKHLARSCFLAVLLSISSAPAADFWDERPYQEWSDKECIKLLTRSPWAFSNSFRQTADFGGSETAQTEIIYCRLLSAAPIKMALGQLQLLEKPQDNELRRQVEEFVGTVSEDQILVQISYKSIPAGSRYLQALHSFFGRATRASFHGNTLLVSSHKVNVALLDFLPWTASRPNPVLVFPRRNEAGQPYFSDPDDSITLRSEIEVEAGGLTRQYRLIGKLKLKDMMFKGEVNF